MNDPFASECPGVCEGAHKLDAGVTHLASTGVDGYEAITRPDDLVQVDREFLPNLEPAVQRPEQTLLAAIGLANVIGQDRVLIREVGVEEGQVWGLARRPPLPECSEPLHVLLRHRLLPEPHGF